MNEQVGCIRYQAVQIKLGRVDDDLARFDTGKVEDVLDYSEQDAGRGLDTVCKFLLLA